MTDSDWRLVGLMLVALALAIALPATAAMQRGSGDVLLGLLGR